MFLFSSRRRDALITFCIVVGIMLPFIVVRNTVRANALFSHTCQSDGSVTFVYQGQPWHTVPYETLYAPVAMAIATQEHQVIIMEDEISLWALFHDELQIHRNDNPDGTKYIIPSNSCAPLPQPLYVVMMNGQALAIAEAQAGGMASAFAYIAPDGSVFTFAYVEGPGPAMALAQTTVWPTNTWGTTPATDRRTHVVQAGENLFRISLLYGILLERLAAINGISNINLIFVGQVLYLE